MRILLVACLAAGLVMAADWPQLLGPHRDGVYPGPPIRSSFPAGGPPEVWSKEVGEGFASPAVADGRLILFHRRGGEEIVEALEAVSGKPVWSYAYPTAYRDDFGFDAGPRSAPTIVNNRVYTFGAQGVLTCLDFETGKKMWSVDTHRRFRVSKGFFGAASSPLVADGEVVINVGGDEAGVVGFDAETGEVAWQATDHPAGYSAAINATIDGKPHILAFTRTGLADIEPGTGRVRFEYRWRSRSNATVNAALPLASGNLVFLSASYGTGAILLRIGPKEPEKVWSSDDVLSNHYATSVLKDGYLYGYHGRQEMGPSLRCVELMTGKVMWSEERFRAGTVTLAGEQLLLVREGGEIVLAPATPTGFKPTSRAKVLEKTVRAYPALAGGLLYIRNESRLICIDLRPD